MNASDSIRLGDLSHKMGSLCGIKNPEIYFLGCNKKYDRELTLKQLGVKGMTGVIVIDGGV